MDLSGILANISAFTGPQRQATGAQEHPNDVACAPAAGAADGVAAVVFSRDRPYQLAQLLRSIEVFATGVDAVYVLYTCSERWEAQYEEVLGTHANVVAVRESVFEEDLRDIVFGRLLRPHQQSGGSGSRGAVGSVLFLVDDALFTSSVRVDSFARTLRATADAFAVQLKLHPGIVFSHPAMSACTRPRLVVCSGPEDPDLCLMFDLRAGSHDWSYPFDLCGGLYRVEDVQRLLDAARGQIRNPNVFEVAGNKCWRSMSARRPNHSLCCAKQALVVVTTNKVQDTFDVPIYDSPQGELEALNATQEQLAPRAYANKPYFLSHVGDLLFELPASISQPQLSVVIPAFNAARFLPECLHSLEQQTGVVFEVIVVDDGSEDGTLEVLRQFEEQRVNESCVEMKVVRTIHQGLVAALNTGVAAAQHNIIARLDADDVCLPKRLSRQLEFLLANPNVAVLGAQAARFSDPPDAERTVMTAPTHPLLAQWRLFLESPVLHPTVCFRRDALLEATGGGDKVYEQQIVLPRDEAEHNEAWAQAHDLLEAGGFADSGSGRLAAANCVEDLELWCRLAATRPFCIASVPDVLLAHRAHPQQKSRMEFEKATAQATVVLWMYIKRVLGGGLPDAASIRHLHVLRRPARAGSVAELEGAYRLLTSARDRLKAEVEAARERSTIDELSQYAMEVVGKSVASKARELGAAAWRLGPASEARKLAETMGLASGELLQSMLLAALSS